MWRYTNGKPASILQLGPQLPIDSIIRTRVMDIGDLLWDTVKSGLSFYTQPSTWASFLLQNKYGEDTPMMLPSAEKFMEAADHPEPEHNFYFGKIVVDIYTPLPTSSRTKNTPPISGYMLRNTVSIEKEQ